MCLGRDTHHNVSRLLCYVCNERFWVNCEAVGKFIDDEYLYLSIMCHLTVIYCIIHTSSLSAALRFPILQEALLDYFPSSEDYISPPLTSPQLYPCEIVRGRIKHSVQVET